MTTKWAHDTFWSVKIFIWNTNSQYMYKVKYAIF